MCNMTNDAKNLPYFSILHWFLKAPSLNMIERILLSYTVRLPKKENFSG